MSNHSHKHASAGNQPHGRKWENTFGKMEAWIGTFNCLPNPESSDPAEANLGRWAQRQLRRGHIVLVDQKMILRSSMNTLNSEIAPVCAGLLITGTEISFSVALNNDERLYLSSMSMTPENAEELIEKSREIYDLEKILVMSALPVPDELLQGFQVTRFADMNLSKAQNKFREYKRMARKHEIYWLGGPQAAIADKWPEDQADEHYGHMMSGYLAYQCFFLENTDPTGS